MIPEYRPNVTLSDRDGKPRTLSEWDGKPLIINFWATWCAPCRREIPMLNALAKEEAYAEFEVIGIAIDFRDDVLKYLEKMPIDYTVLIGEQDGMAAARAFGMESIGLPFTAFTDRQGRIATIHVGELHLPTSRAILSAFADVDAGRIDLATARSAHPGRDRRPFDALARRSTPFARIIGAQSGQSQVGPVQWRDATPPADQWAQSESAGKSGARLLWRRDA